MEIRKMSKNSFRDPVTNVLKAWGYVERNHDGDIVRIESDDFDLAPGKYKLVDDEWVAVSATIADVKANAIKQIDADVDAIYGAVVGNRQSEYDAADVAAQTYKAAGYAGTVPAMVQSWADAKAWTPKQAADDILATAANWRTAQANIRANRLACKESVRNATTAETIESDLVEWGAFVTGMRTALGV